MSDVARKDSAEAAVPLKPGERRPLMAGNWKMNLNLFEAIGLTQKLAFSLNEKQLTEVEVVLLPPFVDIRSVQTLIDADNLLIGYGAQDLSPYDSGAYTGDVSGPMLAKLGCQYVIVGHSERRTIHGEDRRDLVAEGSRFARRTHGSRTAPRNWTPPSTVSLPSRCAVSSWRTNRSGRSAPARPRRRPTRRRSWAITAPISK